MFLIFFKIFISESIIFPFALNPFDIAKEYPETWEIIKKISHELMNMAQVQWWNGHYDKAREYAQAALTQLEDLIPRRRKQEALYRSRRSIVLALLGRIDEARAELAAVRQLPLCEGCDYCTCKDADIFEANMEEICGHWEQALALHRAGAERWHDDLDFVSGMRRMMRKGYSHDDRH